MNLGCNLGSARCRPIYGDSDQDSRQAEACARRSNATCLIRIEADEIPIVKGISESPQSEMEIPPESQ